MDLGKGQWEGVLCSQDNRGPGVGSEALNPERQAGNESQQEQRLQTPECTQLSHQTLLAKHNLKDRISKNFVVTTIEVTPSIGRVLPNVGPHVTTLTTYPTACPAPDTKEYNCITPPINGF